MLLLLQLIFLKNSVIKNGLCLISTYIQIYELVNLHLQWNLILGTENNLLLKKLNLNFDNFFLV